MEARPRAAPPGTHAWAEEDPLTIRHEEPDALWSVCESLSYAEQRYDSRSKPMSIFLLKIGPALEVLKDVSVL